MNYFTVKVIILDNFEATVSLINQQNHLITSCESRTLKNIFVIEIRVNSYKEICSFEVLLWANSNYPELVITDSEALPSSQSFFLKVFLGQSLYLVSNVLFCFYYTILGDKFFLIQIACNGFHLPSQLDLGRRHPAHQAVRARALYW